MPGIKTTFLSACGDFTLTKEYIREPDGSLSSRPYPLTSKFTSHVEWINDLDDLAAKIKEHSLAGHCMLKGNLTRDIVCESRAGLMAPSSTQFICLDFDGIILESQTIDDVLSLIGLGDTDYIIQYSSSQGINPGFYAHIFMLTDREVSPEHLKRWLKHVNLNVPFLADNLRLTATKTSIHWGLDLTTCQNDKLLYIAPPLLVNIPDPLPNGRVTTVRKTRREAFIPEVHSDTDTQRLAKLKMLRSKEGLPELSEVIRYDAKHHADVFKNPGAMSITGMRTARGWTYLNINGSTTWGYYHKTDNPEVVGNFRGEPFYLTRDINPTYYHEALERAKLAKRQAHMPEDPSKAQFWVLNDRKDGRYYKASYVPGSGITLSPAPSIKHLEDFCTLHKIGMPDAIPDWDVKFDPTNPKVFDPKERWVNLFRPTKYKVSCLNRFSGDARAVALGNPNSGKIPSVYYNLLKHVCGDDEVATERFINWLAFIWQTGRKPKTAWVLHGTYGTGKGRFLKVLLELFGDHCIPTSPEAMNEMFNLELKTSQIMWIDEVTTDAWENSKVTPKLRGWISEDNLSIRAMRKDRDSKEPNFTAFIVAANEYNPVEIRDADRRWNVAPRQERPLKTMPWATPDVLDDFTGWIYKEENIQAFADALFLYRVDVSKVIEPMENDAKSTVMQVTQNLPEDIIQALQKGRVSFFLEHVMPNASAGGGTSAIDAMDYKAVVARIMQGGRQALKTTEVATIFRYLLGWNQPVAKFVKAASKYGLMLSNKRARREGAVIVGDYFDFVVTEDDRALWNQLNEAKLRVVKQG